MELKKTSNFNLGSNPSADITDIFFGNLQQAKAADQIRLRRLCMDLENGIHDVCGSVGLNCALESARITEQILSELIKRNDSTSIEINSENYVLRLEETEGNIIISFDSAKDLLLNMTFKYLMQTIIRNIVHSPFYFSSDAIHYALNHVFTNSTDNDLKTNGASYLVQTRLYHINPKRQWLIFLAASHVFSPQQDVEDKIVREIAILAVKSANNWQHLKILEAAQHILRNQTSYHLTLIKSASFLILINQEGCNDEVLQLATDHIADNPTIYPEQFLIKTALTIIKTHWEFFRIPIKGGQAQQDFVGFFQERGAMESLTNYSNTLVNLLRSSDEQLKRGFTIEEWDDTLKQKVKKTLSIEGMWIDGHFQRVLEANVAIAIFVLQNMRHAAIKVWNSPDNPLAHSTR